MPGLYFTFFFSSFSSFLFSKAWCMLSFSAAFSHCKMPISMCCQHQETKYSCATLLLYSFSSYRFFSIEFKKKFFPFFPIVLLTLSSALNLSSCFKFGIPVTLATVVIFIILFQNQRTFIYFFAQIRVNVCDRMCIHTVPVKSLDTTLFRVFYYYYLY